MIGTKAHDYFGKSSSEQLLLARGKETRSFVNLPPDASRREEETQPEMLLESMPDAVVAFDRQWRITYVNAAAEQLNNVSRDSVLGRSLWEVFPAIHGTIVEREFRRAMADRVPVRFETSHECDGRWFESDVNPLNDGGVAAYTKDITERKQREEAQHQADRRKDEFLAMLGHELRNPLAAVMSALQLIKIWAPQHPALQGARDVAQRQAGHMAHLLDDLLDISRVTRGKITLQKEQVPLSTVIENAVEATRPLMESKGHRFVVSFPPDLQLLADSVRLTQVLSNLLDNAVKYTPPGGEVYLTAEREDSKVVIRVRDNGSGITPELLPHIFDLFVQADLSADRAQGGLGIGLTMVRSLVEMHGGQVDACSNGAGKGSEFVLRLPLLLSPTPAIEAQNVEPENIKSRRILVVEDDSDLAEVLSSLLDLDGHEVVTALSGQAAIEMAKKHRPEVALIDLGMPGMDGFELARRLRQEPTLAQTNLVALTGYGREEDRQKSREAGFTHHLLKPVDMETLRRVLAAKTCSAKPNSPVLEFDDSRLLAPSRV